MKECFYSEGISSLLDAMEQQDIHLEEDMIRQIDEALRVSLDITRT